MVLSMKMERLKIMYRNLDIYEVEKILVNNYKNNKLELINRIIAYYHLSDYCDEIRPIAIYQKKSKIGGFCTDTKYRIRLNRIVT